jgi:uncharacterized membrane protein
LINWLVVVRWIHILASAAWLGEVITINFVLIPMLFRVALQDRRRFIKDVFPLVFRLASILSLITVAAGLALNYLITEWRYLDIYFTTTRGIAILVGGLLGLFLIVFHFALQRRLEPLIDALNDESGEEDVQAVARYLQIIPRLGLGVMILTFILMMYGARGF